MVVEEEGAGTSSDHLVAVEEEEGVSNDVISVEC